MDILSFLYSLDIGLVRLVRESLSCDLLDFLMPLVTLIGEHGILWIVLSLLLMFFKKTRKAGFVMALSLLIGFLLVNLTIKPLVGRVRPYVVDNVPILIKGLGDGSFPSGHTLACFEGAASLYFCSYKKCSYAAFVAAALVAFSRVYLYVHYPSDVIVGAILGVLFAYIANIFVNKLYKTAQKSETL